MNQIDDILNADSEFNEYQLERKKKSILCIMRNFKILDMCQLEKRLMLLAYNAGYADCQNETKDSWKIIDK